MSAIQSLLRVMTLRDAEAIVLEADKVPSLRVRGEIQKLAMPPLEAQLLTDFAAPLLAGRSLDDGPASLVFHDVGGAHYQVTIERVAAGLRVVVRPGKPSVATARSGARGSDDRRQALTIVRDGEAVASAGPRRSTSQSASRAAATTPTAHGSASSGSASASPGSASESPGRGALTSTDAPAERALPVDSAGSAERAMGMSMPVAAQQSSRSTSEDDLARLAQVLAPFVAVAQERGASDVILSTGIASLRVAGRLEPLEFVAEDAELAGCVAALGPNTDHSLELSGTRLRVNLFDHLNGVGVAARLIRDRVPGLAELALPAELGAVIEQRDGLVLVCGPTGSGKSTTLAALIDLLDQRRAAHVITLEDPIEYRFAARRGIVHQREVGRHVPSFAAGLRSALREAPDVILLGELRDRDTIAAALTAAETGHLVLATLHAPSAAGAIDRMIDAFPEAQQRQARWQLAAVLRTVVTQYLLPRRDGGRIPAIELVPITTAVANLMRKGDLQMLPSAIQTGRDAGMIPLERSLARILETGAVAPQVIKSIAADHDLLASLSAKLR
jgi:twitching motility protein PilT